LPPLPKPPANGRLIVLEKSGDVSDWLARIDGSQRSFTDIVGGVRALHNPSLPDEHNFSQAL
jgi:hypothetical protein